ncbi:MAG: hypothetical protein FH749_13025 [Firmicutes bacterium]|nr:hypothetical protein [Bacillota bacterium]
MDERLRVLQLVREQKVSPEAGLVLLQELEGTGISENAGTARQVRVTIHRKDGEDKQTSFKVPLSVLRFLDGLFPEQIRIDGNSFKRQDLLDFIDRGVSGDVLRKQHAKGEVVLELV